VDFTGKSVVDLGCGYGDFLWRAYVAGASRVLGIDRDPDVVKAVRFRLESHGYAIAPVHAVIGNLDAYQGLVANGDIAFCFSVLPYLKKPDRLLQFMSSNFQTSLVECQYWGDGPGLSNVKNDVEMRDWLENYWTSVENIGNTLVRDRGAVRTIWKLESPK